MKKNHTIILIQYTSSYASRTFIDFGSINDALDAVVNMYQTKLKELNPSQSSITYEITHLETYIDSLEDICALVLDTDNKYQPYDKAWIKKKIAALLRGQAK